MSERLRVVRTTPRIVPCSVPGCAERGETDDIDITGKLYLCQTHLAAWQFVVWCAEQLGLIAPERRGSSDER